MAANDAALEQVFQEWDDKKIKVHNGDAAQHGLGPWAKLVGQRMGIFTETWRPDRMKVVKKLDANADANAVRSKLTAVAREDFVSDLRAWGVPDRQAHSAGSLVEVK
jgi:hypothetical protein